jgi:hypothetical protein
MIEHGMALHDIKKEESQNYTLGQQSYENCFLGC